MLASPSLQLQKKKRSSLWPGISKQPQSPFPPSRPAFISYKSHAVAYLEEINDCETRPGPTVQYDPSKIVVFVYSHTSTPTPALYPSVISPFAINSGLLHRLRKRLNRIAHWARIHQSGTYYYSHHFGTCMFQPQFKAAAAPKPAKHQSAFTDLKVMHKIQPSSESTSTCLVRHPFSPMQNTCTFVNSNESDMPLSKFKAAIFITEDSIRRDRAHRLLPRMAAPWRRVKRNYAAS
ncbi:hypothetical protein HDV63DRAFT_136632 [Trichoderma sp. SZMC 28014]